MPKKEIDNETGLMEGFREGQHSCFTEVFNWLYAPLCHYASQIIHDQAAAEDIVEDSFIKIWERREIFFEIKVLKAYLYTTVKNASINWIKKNSKTSSFPDDIFYDQTPEEPNIFGHIVSSEVYNQLSSAVERLSPQGKQIIKMIFFEGKKTRTVAEELGISESTVKTQKGRSLHKLKKNIISPK